MNLEGEILQVNLDDIIPNRFQPRIAFDEQGLKELSDSIKEHGIIQPLVLRKLGDKYEIIAGERRYKAATLAGLTTVPAVISNIDDNKSAEVALVENIQRRDLTPIEEAKSYKSLLDKGYLTQEELAKKMGISQSAVANKLRLLNLDEEVQQALLAEKISERHARSLLQLPTKDQQRKWLERVISERLTVRQLDQEIKKEIDDSDSDDSIPKIELTPSIDDIKAKAEDINPSLTEFNPLESKINSEINPVVMQEELEPMETETQTSNKFFNFNDEMPVNMEMNEINNDNVFNTNKEVEIIDMPALNVEQASSSSITDEIPQNSQSEVLDFNDDMGIEISANNKFFTPLSTDNSAIETLDGPKEQLIDPMTVLETFGSNEEEDLELDIADAISITRSVVDELKDRGINVTSNETNESDFYEIVIRIEK